MQYYEICDKLTDLYAPDSLIKAIGNIDSNTFLLEKTDDLKAASDKLHELVKKKNNDSSKWKEVEDMFKKCASIVAAPGCHSTLPADLVAMIPNMLLSTKRWAPEEREKLQIGLERSGYIKSIEKTTDNFVKKYIKSGFLPELPENKEITCKRKKVLCGIALEDYEKIIETYLSIIISKKDSGYNISPEEFLAGARRLLTVNKIIFDDLKENFFNYYPFTTKGEFKKTMVSVADSGFIRYQSRDGYTEQSGFRLVTMPTYLNEMYDINENELIIAIDYSASKAKTPPIFDVDNNPSKPVMVKTIYIKQEELIPGHIYIEKPDGTKLIYLGTTTRSSSTCYAYLRLTKKVEKTAKNCTDLDGLLRTLLEEVVKKKKKDGSYKGDPFISCARYVLYDLSGYTEYMNPKKFIADVGQLTFKE